MDTTNNYPYFGEEMLLTQFSLLAESIQKALPPDSQGQNAIAQQLLRINSKKEKWPSRILSLYRNRTLPVFSMEGVTKLNQAHDAFINDVNDTRRRQKDSLKSDMSRKKKQLDDMKAKKEKYIDSYESIVLAARNEQSLYGPNSFEYAQFSSKIASAEAAYISSMRRLTSAENEISHELALIERNYIPIRLLSNQSNQKNLICPKNNSFLGWIPHLDSYQLIQNVKPPPKEEIFRHCSYEPESKLTNLPLSIFNIITFADQIGATDQTLLTMLTIYLRQYKPIILETLDTKKQNLNAVIETLAFHCTTTHEKAAILHRLRTFQRNQYETFAACISRFDGLHVFYLQLDQPSEADQVRLLSYQTVRQVTPYLISAKCSAAFGQWIVESVKLQTEITKESIIRIITSLESHSDLRSTTSRQLPGFMITATLNLPPGETDLTIQAQAALGVTPSTIPPPKSPSRSGSFSKTPPSTFGRPPSPGKPRPPSPGKPPFPNKSRSRGRDQSTPRRPSPSPNRNNRDDRGRSSSARSPAPSARSSSTNAYIAELDVLQYYSIHAKSPKTDRKKSMSSVFRRPLTPKTYGELKGSFFFKTNPERFKNVMKEGRCLRCWSTSHRAAACSVYTTPTPSPCRFCHYLFHSSDQCRFYDDKGKSKPPSRASTPTPK
jgi:hypothetical protein